MSDARPPLWRPAPLLRVPERSRTIFRVTALAACGPLAMGGVFFGTRALVTTALALAGCVFFDWAYFRVTRTPAMLGRTHAWLTGLLLALTLPPFVPWYVPLTAAAFAIIVGKAISGGVGHFFWQPALVGRLAVAAMFSTTLNPVAWPLLAPAHMATGDVRTCSEAAPWRGWSHPTVMPEGVDGPRFARPMTVLGKLYDRQAPPYERITDAVTDLPEMFDMMIGAAPGGIGETASLVLVVMGVYLIYRHYVSWLLPAGFLLAAAVVAAATPVRLSDGQGGVRLLWWPLTAEGLDVGVTYVACHLVSGGLLLSAFFLAPETTTSPVTPRGQLLFGLGCGAAAMLLRATTDVATPSYVAVLLMNTTVPLLERFTRPRVLGTPPWWRKLSRRRPGGSFPAKD